MDQKTVNDILLVVGAIVLAFLVIGGLAWIAGRMEKKAAEKRKALLEDLLLVDIVQFYKYPNEQVGDREPVMLFVWQDSTEAKYVSEFAQDIPRNTPVEIGGQEAIDRKIIYSRLSPVEPVAPIEYANELLDDWD